MKYTVLAAFICIAFQPSTGFAQPSDSGCTIIIQSPNAHQEVGENGNVTGQASNIPPGSKLWIFAHRAGLALWWPQGGGPANIDIHTGAWKILVYYGEPRDIGNEFQIIARVFDDASNKSLEEWVKKSTETNQYPGIQLPTSSARCLSEPIVVTKMR